MSEQESNIPAEEDAELHGRRRTVMASDEPSDEAETEGDDDVELHGNRRKVL